MDPLFLASIVILFFCVLGLSWFAGSDAPYVASQSEKYKPVLKDLGIKKGKIFFELGSGDGRVVLDAARLGAQAFGIEQSWLRVWYSRYKAHKQNLHNAYFCHGNVFKRSYQHANFIYIYLLQKAVDNLEKKLKKELNKGSIIITQTYHFKNWEPYKSRGNFNFYRVW